MAPFEVRPAVFELDRGQAVKLEVLFAPGDVKSYSEQMTMVCDNCHVKHFTITGRIFKMMKEEASLIVQI